MKTLKKLDNQLVPSSYSRFVARELELQERDLVQLLQGTALPVGIQCLRTFRFVCCCPESMPKAVETDTEKKGVNYRSGEATASLDWVKRFFKVIIKNTWEEKNGDFGMR